MKRDIAERWMEALRSGEYPQGDSYLKIPVDGQTEWCCLGVLCHLSVEEGVVREEKSGFHWVNERSGLEHFESMILPAPVVAWAGMKADNCSATYKPFDSDKHYYVDLVDANDAGVPFADIADLIEDHWEEL